MKNKSFTMRLCRAGVIAALYVALTYAFLPVAFGSFQIRPAEALCILPLFFPEAIPALYVGCLLANLASSPADIILGSFATLIAACGTYLMGKYIKNTTLKIFLGGLFPVLCNAFIIPVIIVFLGNTGASEGSMITYFITALSIGFTEAVWVYALGTPLYFAIKKYKPRLK